MSDEHLQELPEPANLRFLRRLITVLTLTMIFGLLTIIGLIVMRFTGEVEPPVPSEIVLPDGAKAQSFTLGSDWAAVVTQDDLIIIFDREDYSIRQTIQILPKQIGN
jgi:hypothetical protein